MGAVPSSRADKCGYLLYSGFRTCRKTICSSFTMISDLTKLLRPPGVSLSMSALRKQQVPQAIWLYLFEVSKLSEVNESSRQLASIISKNVCSPTALGSSSTLAPTRAKWMSSPRASGSSCPCGVDEFCKNSELSRRGGVYLPG